MHAKDWITQGAKTRFKLGATGNAGNYTGMFPIMNGKCVAVLFMNSLGP